MSIIFRRVINQHGLDIIKKWESLHDGDLSMVGLQPKLCPRDVWTEGWGRAMRGDDGKFLTRRNCTFAEAIKRSTIKTIEEADAALLEDTAVFSRDVDRMLTHSAVTSNQFSACVSLCYNIGQGNFSTSDVRKYVNFGRFDLAANAFRNWRRSGGQVLRGLVNRREDEIRLFNKRGREG
jgi:lysozyme